MWLLELHIAASILLMITCIGLANMFKEKLKKNGWYSGKGKGTLLTYLYFFVPLINIFITIVIILMISKTREEYDEFLKDMED